MPTIARLLAAVILAALAWVVSEQIKPLFLEGTAFGWFNHINAGLGLVIGWQVIGSRVGRGYSAAISNGLTGGAVLVFWALLLHAAIEMFEKSMRLRYDGAFEAFAAVFEIMAEHGLLIATPLIITTALAGSILAGVAAEAFDRFSS